MTSKLGVYWSVMHRRQQDYDYFKQLQPSVFKIMDGGQPDYQWANANLPNSLIIARDWALSEQHDDMRRDPIGTGRRHAQEWNQHAARLGFNRAKTLVLGINEPRVWESGIPAALVDYTFAFCEECTRLGLRAGAMQLSVGWPANTGPDTPPDWSPYTPIEAAIRRGNHALVCHEYWADNGPSENWGWWAGRSLTCPWDVPIVIGECGVDMYVKDSSVEHSKRGWHGRMEPTRYAGELAEYVGRMSADRRFVGCSVFASDFASHEWFSFDIELAYQAILATPVPVVEPQQQPVTVHLPSIGNDAQPQPTPQPATVPTLSHPIADPALRIISQRFGENPQDYARFGLAGHGGIDFACPVGTAICAVDDGVPIEIENDFDGYGIYVKVRHTWGESLYAHLSQELCDVGKPLQAGEALGLSGYTGNVDPPGPAGAHLHFAMRIYPYTRGAPWDGYSDPMPYLGNTVAPQPTPITHVGLTPKGIIKASATVHDFDYALLASLAWAESSWQEKAVSDAGAMGILQIMPATWAEWSQRVDPPATDPFNDAQNLEVGIAYLKWLLEQTGGNVWNALVAYNWGIGNLLSGATIPDESAEFANKVIFGRDLLKATGE